MKAQDLADAQAIARLIETGTATRRDWVAFLIYIRESISDDMIKDLAHFVAHTKRDRGYAHAYITSFAQQMYHAMTQGGKLDVHAVFDLNELVDQLCNDARTLGIDLDRAAVNAHRAELEATLSDVLDGSSMKLKLPEGVFCEIYYLTPGSAGAKLCFVLESDRDVVGPLRTIPAGQPFAVTMFG